MKCDGGGRAGTEKEGREGAQERKGGEFENFEEQIWGGQF